MVDVCSGQVPVDVLFLLFTFFALLPKGPCQDKDGEKGRSGHHREVLHPPGQRLPHQQAGVWGDCHHPQQEAPQQDRRVRAWPLVMSITALLDPVSKVTVVSGCQVIDTTGRETWKSFPCLLDNVFLTNPVSFTHALLQKQILNQLNKCDMLTRSSLSELNLLFIYFEAEALNCLLDWP